MFVVAVGAGRALLPLILLKLFERFLPSEKAGEEGG